MQGWITIHRQIIDSPIYSDSHAVHLWLHLLILANHKDNTFVMNGVVKSLKRGQFITGRDKLVSATGINRSKIERLLKTFVELEMIEVKTSNRNRLVTLINYDSYQSDSAERATSEQPVSNQRATGEQLVSTNNNVNNENNVNNKTIRSEKPDWLDKFYDEFWKLYPKGIDKKKYYIRIKKMISKGSDREKANLLFNSVKAQLVGQPDGQFWATADRWLKDEKWTDEVQVNTGGGFNNQPTPKKLKEL